jgi:hypothetical protein
VYGFFLDAAINNAVGFALEDFRSIYYINEMERKQELMTAREFARKLNIPYTTVAGWLQKGQVPGAEAQIVGTFKVWMIPVEVLKGFERPKRGRPPLTDEEKATRTKKRKAGSQASLFEQPATAAKPKAGTKKAGLKNATKKKGGASK